MKKKVDVFCSKAFTVGAANFAGRCFGIVLDVETIRICLFNKALVWELTDNGKRIALDLSNYRKDNGGVVEDDVTTANDESNRSTKITNITFKQDSAKSTEKVEETNSTPAIRTESVEDKTDVKEEKKTVTVNNNNQQKNKFKNSKA